MDLLGVWQQSRHGGFWHSSGSLDHCPQENWQEGRWYLPCGIREIAPAHTEGSLVTPKEKCYYVKVIVDRFNGHELQHTRPFCPSPSPRVCPSSCPLHRQCCPVISSSDTVFSFCAQSFQQVFRLISLKIDWFDLLTVQVTGLSIEVSYAELSLSHHQ